MVDGYGVQQSSLFHVFVRFFVLDRAQNTISFDFFPNKGLFTWRKVVPGRRVTLLPEPSFTERVPGRRGTLAKCLYGKKLLNLLIKKFMKSYLAQGGSVWRVTLLPYILFTLPQLTNQIARSECQK